MIGSTTLLRILIATVPCRLRSLLQHSFEGACSPLNRITDTNTMTILSSVARDLILINLLLWVHLVGSVPHHFSSPFIDKFYALQNGPPNSSLQILTLTSLRNGLVPSRRPFRPVPSPTPHFYLNGMATQPTAVRICSGTYQCSGKSEIWGVPNVMIALGFIDDGPVGDPDANPRLHDFLIE